MNPTRKPSRIKVAAKKAGIPVVALFALTVIILWTTGVHKRQVEPSAVDHKPGFSLPANAETFVVEKRKTSRKIPLPGTLISDETVRISPRLSAHIKHIHVRAGETVRAGSLMISMDDRDVTERLAAARAARGQAETEYRRTERLYESGAATHREYVAARSEFRSAKAREEEARIMRAFTEIRSPVDGIVANRFVDAGELVSPGQILMTLFDPDAMRLEVQVPERFAGHMAVGDRAAVRIIATDAVHEGIIDEMAGSLDPAARTRTVRVRVDVSGSGVPPGTFGRMIVGAEPEEGVFIPRTAVFRVGQLEMVQMVSGDRVVRRLVRTAPADNSMIEILSGLDEGETVLIHPRPGRSGFQSEYDRSGNPPDNGRLTRKRS